ncbi:hypothetical protein ACH5RR_007386, partial [Cinchona calisaya]
ETIPTIDGIKYSYNWGLLGVDQILFGIKIKFRKNIFSFILLNIYSKVHDAAAQDIFRLILPSHLILNLCTPFFFSHHSHRDGWCVQFFLSFLILDGLLAIGGAMIS